MERDDDELATLGIAFNRMTQQLSAQRADLLAAGKLMDARRRLTEDHSIEKVGSQLRSMMPWIAKNKLVDKTRN